MITTKSVRFREGEDVILVAGAYLGRRGVFLRLREDTQWADIVEHDGRIRSHPVLWLARADSAAQHAAS